MYNERAKFKFNDGSLNITIYQIRKMILSGNYPFAYKQIYYLFYL